jgi:hypothetical protein
MKAIPFSLMLVASAAVAQQCPSDQEIRNMEVSASSVTIKAAEKQHLQEQVRLARACRMGPDALRAETDAQAADRDRQRRCQVQPNGNIWCSKNR